MNQAAQIYVDEAVGRLAAVGNEENWRMIENDIIYAGECLRIAWQLNKGGAGKAAFFDHTPQ